MVGPQKGPAETRGQDKAFNFSQVGFMGQVGGTWKHALGVGEMEEEGREGGRKILRGQERETETDGTDSGQLCIKGSISHLGAGPGVVALLAGTRACLSHVTAGRFLDHPRLHFSHL